MFDLTAVQFAIRRLALTPLSESVWSLQESAWHALSSTGTALQAWLTLVQSLFTIILHSALVCAPYVMPVAESTATWVSQTCSSLDWITCLLLLALVLSVPLCIWLGRHVCHSASRWWVHLHRSVSGKYAQVVQLVRYQSQLAAAIFPHLIYFVLFVLFALFFVSSSGLIPSLPSPFSFHLCNTRIRSLIHIVCLTML